MIPIKLSYLYKDNIVGYYLIPDKYLYEYDHYMYLTSEGKLWFMREYDGPLGESYFMERMSEKDISGIESRIKYLKHILSNLKDYVGCK